MKKKFFKILTLTDQEMPRLQLNLQIFGDIHQISICFSRIEGTRHNIETNH